MLLVKILNIDMSSGCGTLSVYQHAGYYCKISGCLGCALEGKGCNVNKNALPPLGTLIPFCNINVHISSSGRARYWKSIPAAGIRQRMSVFPQGRELLALNYS